MSENVTVSSLEELYQAVVAAFGTEAPEQIAVVSGDGETTVYSPN